MVARLLVLRSLARATQEEYLRFVRNPRTGPYPRTQRVLKNPITAKHAA